MTDPRTQMMYVMQNECGCIKIGRSVDPWQRRLNLRQSEHCTVELIAAFNGGGEHEEAIHKGGQSALAESTTSRQQHVNAVQCTWSAHEEAWFARVVAPNS